MSTDAIPTRTLGASGLEITEVGCGLWAAGGHWGPTDDEASLAGIEAALEAGVNFFDTADVYGDGRSERLLGQAMVGRRERFVVATKLGWVGYDGDAGHSQYTTVDKLVSGVEASLKRLGTDYLDVIQCHIWYPDPTTEVFIEGFRRLKAEGKVRAWGVSTSDLALLKTFGADGDGHVLQIDYSILNRDAEREVFPYCRDNGIGVIVRGPLAMGLLTGKFLDATPTFTGDDFRRAWLEDPQQRAQYEADLATVRGLRDALGSHRPLPELALRFVLEQGAVTTVIPGARNARQARSNAAAGRAPRLTRAEKAAIDALVPPGGGRKIWPAEP